MVEARPRPVSCLNDTPPADTASASTLTSDPLHPPRLPWNASGAENLHQQPLLLLRTPALAACFVVNLQVFEAHRGLTPTHTHTSTSSTSEAGGELVSADVGLGSPVSAGGFASVHRKRSR